MGNFVDIRNTSVKVFIIVWGLIKHAGHLVLMILKQYLLTKSPEDKEFIHYSTALGRVSRRTGNTIRAQDGFGYANSHTLHRVEKHMSQTTPPPLMGPVT